MQCKSCNREISDISVFCQFCGASVKTEPPQPPSQFQYVPPPQAQQPPPPPQAYTPPQPYVPPQQPPPQPPPPQPPQQQWQQQTTPPQTPSQVYAPPQPYVPPQQPPQNQFTHPAMTYPYPMQPASAQQSSSKKKIIIPIVIAACVVFAIALALTLPSYFSGSNQYGNTVGNLENFGLAAIDGNRVYYVDPADDDRIYSMNSDGSDLKRLNNLSSSYINVLGGWVYFTAYGDSRETGIYKMRTDGSSLEKLNGNDAFGLMVTGNRIYYVNYSDNSRIYSMDTNGNDRRKLGNESVDCMNVVGDRIYYKNHDDGDNEYTGKIYVMKTDGSENQKVSDDDVFCFNVIGNMIYYINDSDSLIYSIKTDGSNRQRLTYDEAWRINVSGDKIFYVNGDDDGNIYSIRTDGSDRQRVNSDHSWLPNIINDRVYYLSHVENEGFALYSIRTDGRDRIRVSRDSSRTHSQPDDDDHTIAIPDAPPPAPEIPPPVLPDTPAPTPASITINMEALRMIGKTNADLIAINGRQGNSGQFDGGAWIGYERMSVPLPLLFGVEMDLDIFLDIIYNDNLNWNTNIWPDFAVVTSILLWGEQIDFIFQYDNSITYEALCDVMTIIYDLYYLPEDEQIHDSWGFDVWSCTFRFGSYEMYATFEKVGTDLVLIEGLIWATGR